MVSCALNSGEEDGVITQTRAQPVEINPAAIPRFPEKTLEKKSETVTEEKATTLQEPKRKFSFRTPNMIEALPSEKELEKKAPAPTVEAAPEESTTIRATE